MLVAMSVDASPLFDESGIVDVQLTGPMRSLLREKRQRTEFPFKVTANGITQSIEVRSRGKSRLEICKFPPLRLQFVEDIGGESLFAGQRKLKLVTHCRNSNAAQTDVLQEYLAYRVFNLLSDVGFRVRLLRIAYLDTERQQGSTTETHFGFLIESEEGLADRLNGTPARLDGVSLNSLDAEHMAIVYVFQYLIANTDWSLVRADDADACCHNGELLDVGGTRYYIPYDFDRSGIVNARYARPDPTLRIRRVTQRLYRGFCTSRETLQTALQAVKQQKEAIYGLLNEVPPLTEKDRNTSKGFLDGFFDKADDEDKLLAHFERRCL